MDLFSHEWVAPSDRYPSSARSAHRESAVLVLMQPAHPISSILTCCRSRTQAKPRFGGTASRATASLCSTET
jgi:hypothetical protein